MKILITGSYGQLGRCLQDRLSSLEYEWVAVDRDTLDITDAIAVEHFIAHEHPNLIINAAAYTAVDKAESDIDAATSVNEIAPMLLAKACHAANIPLIHVSTDYVFDGQASVPYPPEAPTHPQSVYGKTKLAGELAIQAVLKEHVIIRTAWVFSEYGHNFVKTMLRLSQDHSQLRVIADQYGCPTYAGHLADAILTIVSQLSEGNTHWGTYHYCDDHITSWHGFANAIFDEATHMGMITKPIEVRAINTDEYPVSAKRPGYSVLNCSSLHQDWSVTQASWRQSLNAIMLKLK